MRVAQPNLPEQGGIIKLTLSSSIRYTRHSERLITTLVCRAAALMAGSAIIDQSVTFTRHPLSCAHALPHRHGRDRCLAAHRKRLRGGLFIVLRRPRSPRPCPTVFDRHPLVILNTHSVGRHGEHRAWVSNDSTSAFLKTGHRTVASIRTHRATVPVNRHSKGVPLRSNSNLLSSCARLHA